MLGAPARVERHIALDLAQPAKRSTRARCARIRAVSAPRLVVARHPAWGDSQAARRKRRSWSRKTDCLVRPPVDERDIQQAISVVREHADSAGAKLGA